MQGHTITRRSGEKLARLLRDEQYQPPPKDKRRAVPMLQTVRHVQTPVSGIDGLDTLQMQSAECTVMDCDASGQLSTTSRTLTVFNPSSAAIAGSTELVVAMNDAGLWVAIVESCT